MTPLTATRTVLLTGADGFLGKLVVKRLGATAEVGRILVPLDGAPVRGKKVRQLKVSAASEKITDHLRREKVDVVVHLGRALAQLREEGAFEKNVLGTMTLLGAAAEAPVRHVVLQSSYAVYGAHYTNPNFIPETRRIKATGRSPYLRDAAEIERYALDFLRNFGDVGLTILRFAPIVGPTSDSPFMQYLRSEVCPVLLGFDPLVQLLHEEDAADAVVAAIRAEVRGPIHVAPEGVAPLLKILRFLKKPQAVVPHLPLGLSEKVLGTLRTLPFDPSFLRFGCCLDYDRMREELRFVPRRSTGETLRALPTES